MTDNNDAPTAPPTMQIRLGADNIIASVAFSNVVADDAIEVDSDAFALAMANVNAARWIDGAVVPFTPVRAPKPLRRLAKAELWRRLTNDEAEALDAALAAAPVRLRRIYEAASYLDTTDADYPALRAGVAAALGEERAAEVLEPNS